MKLSVIYEGPNQLGESPLWDHRHHQLYWVDVIACQLHAYNPTTKMHREWQLPAQPGCIALYQENDLIVGLENRLAVIRLLTGKIDFLTPILFDNTTQFNDGKCDPQGRFWIGTKDISEKQPIGSLYRYNVDHSITTVVNELVISNGLDWTKNEKYFLLADSIPRKIYRFAYDKLTGTIENREDFITISDTQGYPDGLTLDSQDYIWLAHWDGWRITRFSPDGTVDRIIDLPIPRPTSCCFGGENFQTLFITSDSRNLSSEQREKAPLSGAVFALSTDVQGKPAHIVSI